MSTIISSDDQSAPCGLVLTGNLEPKAQALESGCQFLCSTSSICWVLAATEWKVWVGF